MKVEIFTLCDAATVDAAGKLNILGSFDHIYGNQTPVTHPLCALAIKMRFEGIEQGQKRIAISFIDSDGKHVMPMLNAPISVIIPPHESTATAQICLIMQQIKLPSFAEYSIDLAVDGRQEASVPLYVRHKQIPPHALPPEASVA